MDRLASGGIFNRSGMTPMESAISAETYDALDWISMQIDKERVNQTQT